ncbi:MAG: DUF2235 domain-containing protein [Polyangiaceae bacterium]|nr:DUF2235 domain-containing protein [Polyangiaceae bacterium]
MDVGAQEAERTVEYDPYGVVLAASSGEGSFGFSTIYGDGESGQLAYNYRKYQPEVGRWLNRDPVGEDGGANLHGFVGNSPIGKIDLLGLALYAFDGTTNNEQNTAKPKTHVSALVEMYTAKSFYIPGVGTTNDTWFNALGTLAGKGTATRMKAMLEAFERNYRKGKGDTKIDIIGFSRGAATARGFANIISKRYPCLTIRFMGLFDTVAALGLPFDPVNFNIGVDLTIPSSVQYVAHAVAAGEYREFFPLSSISSEYRPGSSYAALKEIRGDKFWEKPFAGAHSDIGGGAYHDGANLNALGFVYNAGVSRGVPFDYGRFDADAYKSAPAHDSRYLPFGTTRQVFRGNL